MKSTRHLLEWAVGGTFFSHVNTALVNHFRRSPPQEFLKKVDLEICRKFKREKRWLSVIAIKFLCKFIEITILHGCFPVDFLHICSTAFLKSTCGEMLLTLVNKCFSEAYFGPYFEKLHHMFDRVVNLPLLEKNQSQMGMFKMFLFWPLISFIFVRTWKSCTLRQSLIY